METKHPSFAERIETMRATATALRVAADIVEAETKRMADASERFAARKRDGKK